MKAAPTVSSTRARPSGRLRRTAPLIAIFAGLALFLGACGGGSGPGPGKKSSAQDAAGTGPVAFAQCMRSHGVSNFPDPQNGHFLITGSVQSNPNFHTAQQACQHVLGHGVGNGGSNGSKLLAFSHCMQTHGVPQFPDPSSSGALSITGVDPNSPAFKNAYHECQGKLPGGVQAQQP